MENDKAGYNIVVKDFNDNGDRLSLKEKKSNPIFRWNYTITNSTIKRDGVDDVVVEGSRVQNDFNNKSYADLVRDGIIITR